MFLLSTGPIPTREVIEKPENLRESRESNVELRKNKRKKCNALRSRKTCEHFQAVATVTRRKCGTSRNASRFFWYQLEKTPCKSLPNSRLVSTFNFGAVPNQSGTALCKK